MYVKDLKTHLNYTANYWLKFFIVVLIQKMIPGLLM
jgi:hypothetical protein